jgi:ATP-dependent RNA helicase DDX47/RRP3
MSASSSSEGGDSVAISSTTNDEKSDSVTTFSSLGVVASICEACTTLGWNAPTRIQAETIIPALAGKDIIGLAETGSGKTGAFAIPILQALLENPQRLFALVLAPTRELAFQISEQFEALGAGIGLKTAVIVGGIDMMTQAISLARKPHIVVGTPGRVVDHLTNTKGFSLRSARFLVLDEADRMLSLDFEEAINTILESLPRERRTFLFSATMTSKVAKLQRVSLRDPVRVEVSASRFQTVSTLVQQYLFIPAKHKESFLAYLLNEFAGQSMMVFAATCASAQKISLMLNNLGFKSVCLHGQMGQAKRLGALNKFKIGGANLLIATDVASRGLDIPSVDVVVNFDVPTNGKDYVHRVGRTARAGRAGRAVTFVTQYDIELYQRIEALIGQKLPAYPAIEEAVMLLVPRVAEAMRLASVELREEEEEGLAEGPGGKKRRYSEARGDDEEASGLLEDSSRMRRDVGASVRGRGGGRGGGKFRGRGGRGGGRR